jgi:hypothetical protein
MLLQPLWVMASYDSLVAAVLKKYPSDPSLYLMLYDVRYFSLSLVEDQGRKIVFVKSVMVVDESREWHFQTVLMIPIGLQAVH